MGRVRYQALGVKVLNFAEATLAHEECGTVCQRHAQRSGSLWERGTEAPVLLHVEVGVYRCPPCGCYRTSPLPFAGPRRRYTDGVRKLAVDSIEEDRMPIRRVEHRLGRDFGLSPVPSTLHSWWREGAEAEDVGEYQERVVACFSGVLCLDEVYDDEWAILVATDPLQGRTIAYQLGKTATAQDMEVFCTQIRQMGVDPAMVLTDESGIYPEVLRRVWQNSRHALCRFHVTRQVTGAALAAVRAVHGSMPEPAQRGRGRPRRDEDRSQDEARRQARAKVWKGRHPVVKRREKMSGEERQQLAEILLLAPALRPPRQFMDDWYELFQGLPRPAKLRERRDAFAAKWRDSPYQKMAKLAQKLTQDEFFEKLVVPFFYANAESTTNHVERDNREYRKRQKTHYRMRSERSIRALRQRQLVRHAPRGSPVHLRERFGCRAGQPVRPVLAAAA
jgi:hypothetical protein